MIRRVSLQILLGCLVVAALSPAADEGGDDAPPVLKVYCPRNITVEGEAVTLEQVAVLSCDDADLHAAACKVPMGRAPWDDETIVIERRTLLSRLAASGVDPERVEFSGSEEIRVRRHDKLIVPEQILAVAQKKLSEEVVEPAATWRLVRKPEAIAVPADAEVELTAAVGEHSAEGRVTITVAVMRGEDQLAARDVHFSARYRVRELVATKDLAPGTLVTPSNTEIQVVEKTSAPEPGWEPPYGSKTNRRVSAGTVIRPPLLAEARPEIVVKRNEPVMMKITGECFTISAVGRALEDGRPGDFIRVRNPDTGRVVTAKVAFDGTVKPIVKR